MSEIKWPTDVGEVIIDKIDRACDDLQADLDQNKTYWQEFPDVRKNSLATAFAEIKQFAIDKTTWRTEELNCQATVNFKATVKVPPGAEFGDYVVSEIVQQMDNYVDVQASCNDDELDENCVLTDITDEEIYDFILVDAT